MSIAYSYLLFIVLAIFLFCYFVGTWVWIKVVEKNKQTDQKDDSDLSVFESEFDSLNENDDANTKEVKEVGENINRYKKNQKNLQKEKYKIFKYEYDEVKNAEELENEEEINSNGEQAASEGLGYLWPRQSLIP